MKFLYTATTSTGETIEGNAESASRLILAEELAAKGEQLVRAREITGDVKSKLSRINEIVSKVSLREKIIFARTLSTMIRAGLSLPRALIILKRQTRNIKFQRIIDEVATRISKGENFSSSLSAYKDTFPPLFIAMVHAGEESGKLSDTLLLIAHQLDRQYTLNKKIRGAMMYPMIIFITMIIIGVLMLIYVVPTLTATFEEVGVDLPFSTQIIISVSAFLRDHTILFIAIVLAVIIFLTALFKNKHTKPYTDTFVLYLPLISPIYRQLQSARTARTLASLLSSSIDVYDALSITRDVIQNTKHKKVLELAEENVKKGLPIAKAFEDKPRLYPVLIPEIISVGEETGKLSEMLAQTADFYESEVTTATQDMSVIIEPILMVVIGAAVGFFAISMIQPMYSLLENV